MNFTSAKTIEIFLPDGDPKSIRQASITSRTVEVTLIPRTKLEYLKERDNLSGVAVYILVGNSDDHAKPEVYIGEAENCCARLSQHNASKDFWQYVLVVTSKIGQFTKTHVKFLEWLCYTAGKEAGRCSINNGNMPTKPHVSEPMAADLYDSFDTISVLVSTLGLPLFLPALKDQSSLIGGDLVFLISRHSVKGRGVYTDEGFVVLSGSHFFKTVTPSLDAKGVLSHRQKLIDDGILNDVGDDYYELMEDTLFSSSSNAGASVTGRSTNGWTAWRLPDGRTLSDIYRKES